MHNNLPRINPPVSYLLIQIRHIMTRRSIVRVGIVTLAFQVVRAVMAGAACDGERDDDAIAFFHLCHIRSRFLHYSHRLMPDDIADR